jgi:hypothetical protein
MGIMENELTRIVKARGKMLLPSESFVLAYFRRNKIYLQSAYIIGAMGFFGPSTNIQRTAYESILRGYLFIVNPDEASYYHDNLSLEKIEAFLKTRKHYSHTFLCKELYDSVRQLKQKTFYGILCESAHADIKGLFLDYPAYNEKQIEDNLKITLMLSYGNIQMVSELFLTYLNDVLKYVIKNVLKEVAVSVGNQIPLFEPNKDNYESKLKFKKGNFNEVLHST